MMEMATRPGARNSMYSMVSPRNTRSLMSTPKPSPMATR